MFNLGGWESSHSAMQCRLSSTYAAEWKFVDLPLYSFKRYYDREALVVENTIVYFGWSDKNATFVLERDEDSEQLNVVRENCGLYFRRGLYNTASCVFKNEIYAF